MTCIAKRCACPQGGHKWESYCGRVLYSVDRPYKSVSEYIRYSLGKPVCRRCSILSRLSTAIIKSKRVDERSRM